MRRLATLLLLLAVAAIAIWGLSRGPAPGPEVGETDEEPVAAAPERPNPTAAPVAPPVTAAPVPSRPEPEEAAPPRGFGDLRIRLKAVEGTVDASAVHLDLEAVRPTPEAARLPVRQEDGSWLYDRLHAGRYRVHATVAGFVTSTAESPVVGDQERAAEILLAPGAEIGWKVAFAGGEEPATVRILVLDGRGQRVPVSYQTAASTVFVPASRVVAMPLEGRLVGLRAGRYRVRAESAAGESDEVEVEARPGAPGEVTLRLRR